MTLPLPFYREAIIVQVKVKRNPLSLEKDKIPQVWRPLDDLIEPAHTEQENRPAPICAPLHRRLDLGSVDGIIALCC